MMMTMQKVQNWLLPAIFSDFPEIIISEAFANIEIKGLALDSRQVEPGFLFAALKGTNSDGADFIENAVKAGATAILCDENIAKKSDVCYIKVKNPRQVFSLIAEKYYQAQPDVIAAITGTNGKTSTAHFCREIWAILGKKCASMGTIGITDSHGKFEYDRTGFLTTPDPVKLHKILASLKDREVDYLAMEASSHGLDQYRLDGVHVKIAAFTNFSRDHLDYHGSMEAYFDAKMRLFSEILQENGVAVINCDIPEYEAIEKIAKNRGCTVISYGKYVKGKKNYLELFDVTKTSEGQQIAFEILGKLYTINTRLIGDFQAYNLLCALGVVLASGCNVDEAVAAMAQVSSVPGRMQRVDNGEIGAKIFVDYSHTPDALEKVLQVLRPYVGGKLWVVFGCGGDRDKGKRSQMGAIAADLADNIVITDDNPRGEDPAQIRKQIIKNCPDAIEISDRKEAVGYAVQKLEWGDILLIAGKGHEKIQIIGDEVLPFDDVKVAENAINGAKNGG